MIRIIGTSHIAHESVQTIRKAFEEFKPELVALELDQNRLYALLHPGQKNSFWELLRHVGWKGCLFAYIGKYVQEKLGKAIGMKPGSDMLEAIRLAREQKVPVALIDQDLKITLNRLNDKITWKEKAQVIRDSLFPPKEYSLFKQNLRAVPSRELIAKLLYHLKKNYPNLYRVLVDERNKYMIKKLVELQATNVDKRILVIAGAGHEVTLKNYFERKTYKRAIR